jgi:hypothetical protein
MVGLWELVQITTVERLLLDSWLVVVVPDFKIYPARQGCRARGRDGVWAGLTRQEQPTWYTEVHCTALVIVLERRCCG